MRDHVILMIYGEGGHRAQMKRLYSHLKPGLERQGLRAIGIYEAGDAIADLAHFTMQGVRDKHSRWKTLFLMPFVLASTFRVLGAVITKYRVVGVISTGPGIAIIPSIVLKTLGAKIVFLESWSRFTTQSISGRIMYRIADRFYFQNSSMQSAYPKAIYSGLL